MVIWITGLAGAGKTTLCKKILENRKSMDTNLILFDGDEIREVFGHDVGYRVEDRIKQFGRIQRLAKLLDEQGHVVLIGVLYSNPQLLAWNRTHIKNYFEVYLNVDFDTLFLRDQKKLYSRAKAGEVTEVVGMDIPWIPPVKPDLIIDSKENGTPEYWASIIIDRVPELRKALGI